MPRAKSTDLPHGAAEARDAAVAEVLARHGRRWDGLHNRALIEEIAVAVQQATLRMVGLDDVSAGGQSGH